MFIWAYLWSWWPRPYRGKHRRPDPLLDPSVFADDWWTRMAGGGW